LSEKDQTPAAEGEATAKKPPVHEILIALLNGEFDNELSGYSFADPEYWMGFVTGIIIAKSHFPEDVRPKLVQALINRVKKDGEEFDDYERVATAIKALDGTEAVINALKEAAPSSETKTTNSSYDNLYYLVYEVKIEILKDFPDPK
jgi:hypothetical protein